MPAYAFDTLKAAETLTAAGIDTTHAKAITNMVHDAMVETVATKADIAKINGRLDVLKTEISSIKWVLGLLAAMQILMAGRMFGAF